MAMMGFFFCNVCAPLYFGLVKDKCFGGFLCFSGAVRMSSARISVHRYATGLNYWSCYWSWTLQPFCFAIAIRIIFQELFSIHELSFSICHLN